MQCRLVVGRELVQYKLAFAALEEERHNYSSEVVEAQQEEQPLEQQAPVQGEQQRSSPKDPVVVAVAEEVEQEVPCLVLRRWALLDQPRRQQMDPYYSPASPARQWARYVAVGETSPLV